MWHQADYVYVSQMTLSLENLPHILFRMACGIVVSFAFLHGLSAVFSVAPAGIFTAIGRRSLEIYILHSLVLKSLPAITPSHNPVIFASILAPLLALTFCLLCAACPGSPFGKATGS
jgi:fucose 4-O-acetylase-like acetyltransferase